MLCSSQCPQMEPAAGATDIAVAALVDGGRLLLVHRHPERDNYPDCWDLPGGHVEVGESPEAAVRRECLEELGIEIDDATRFSLACSDPQLQKHAYFVTAWAGTPVNAALDEHDDLGWFTAAELASLTMSDTAGLGDLVALVKRTP